MSKRKVREPARPDRVDVLAALDSGEDAARAWAVRSFCPCRVGWEAFEADIDVVKIYCKDPSPEVRKNAMHVFEDAFEMMGEGLPTTPQALKNEMVARRRQTRWREDGNPRERKSRRRGGLA